MKDIMPKFPLQAKELASLLEDDQREWLQFAREDYESNDRLALAQKKQVLRKRVQARGERLYIILDEIGEPSITNIGTEGALAMSVLATHTSREATRHILNAFTTVYNREKADARYSSIPAMTDWLGILEHKPQIFGTIWLFDERSEPFLPTVEDFEHVNERRMKYGIEPLRWPTSLAIPLDKQPWLVRPLSELTMRSPTEKEYAAFEQDFIS